MDAEVTVIVGATCTGKTALSLLLSEKLNSEIISADSRQIYKYLDIGTAKPLKSELKKVKHHLVSSLEPDAHYSASKFEKDSIAIIKKLLAVNSTPIIVGGSGLYIKALVDGIFDSVDTDDEFRYNIMEERKKFGDQFIFDKLKLVDPKTAAELLPQNWKRVMRALEVYHITGEPIWSHQQKYKREINFRFLQFGLNWDRDVLYGNIEQRVDEMFEKGLIEEVLQILNLGFDKSLNSLNTVGYKEVLSYLEGEITLDRCKELIKRNSRRYAKRQMTWFRKDKRIKWFHINRIDDLDQIAYTIATDQQ